MMGAHLPYRSCRRENLAAFLLFVVLVVMTACGSGQSAASDATPTLSAELAAGQKVFAEQCGPCHSTIPDVVMVGPPLAGIAERAGTRVDGLDARSYLYASIMQPSDYIVEGYTDLMPKDLAKKLTGAEMDSIVAYLLSLE
jgi:hypothetical protein